VAGLSQLAADADPRRVGFDDTAATGVAIQVAPALKYCSAGNGRPKPSERRPHARATPALLNP